MKVTIPRKFKFMSHPYKIRTDEMELMSAGSNAIVKHLHQEVLVSKYLPPSERTQALFHELEHIIERHLQVKIDDPDTDRIAEGWALFFEIFGIELDWESFNEDVDNRR